MAVLESVREFGRAITIPLGAPAGVISTFIEVPFTLGERNLRPDGLIQVVQGKKKWTALVEVKTGRNNLQISQLEAYLDVAHAQGFDALVTISNELVTAPGEHPSAFDKKKLKKLAVHHLSWSQIHTEAVIERVNRSVADPDQAWILSELIRYLEHPRSGAVDFDDMGISWVAVRDGVTRRSLQPKDKGVADVVDRFGQLVAFSAMRLSRSLGVSVRPVLTRAELADGAARVQKAAAVLVDAGILRGSLMVPNAIGPIEVTPTSVPVRSPAPSPSQPQDRRKPPPALTGSPVNSPKPPTVYWSRRGPHGPEHPGRAERSPTSVPTRECCSKTQRKNCVRSQSASRRQPAPNEGKAEDRLSGRSSSSSNASTPR